MSDPILLETTSYIAQLTLNEPDKRNAMSAAMTEAFPKVLKQIHKDVRVLIVTGAGTAFCAGGDLDFLHSGPSDVDSIRDKMTSFYPAYTALLNLDVPTIAAINGPAIGAGCCLALMCDLRVASTKSRLALPFARIGIHPGMLATHLITQTLTQARAAELLYTGKTVTGDEALEMGLVNRCVEPDQLQKETQDLATQVAANAPIALKYIKQGLRLAAKLAADHAAAWESFAQPVTMATEDVKEGLKAIKEKRAPTFKGR